jgi:hypothetical protein
LLGLVKTFKKAFTIISITLVNGYNSFVMTVKIPATASAKYSEFRTAKVLGRTSAKM